MAGILLTAEGSFCYEFSAASRLYWNYLISGLRCARQKWQTRYFALHVSLAYIRPTGCSDIMLAPQFDVRQKLLQLERSSSVQVPFNSVQTAFRTDQLNDSERAAELSSGIFERSGSERSEQEIEMLRLDGMGWSKREIVEHVFKCTKGGSKAWQDGAALYDIVVASKKIGA